VAEYKVAAGRTSVEINGKSSLHPLHGVLRPGVMTGTFRATEAGGQLDPAQPPSAHVELPIVAFSFGNAMYDRELPKRVDADRFPTVTVDLEGFEPAEGDQWKATITLTVHGVAKTFEELVTVSRPDDRSISLSGSHVFDVREFGIQPPKMLGMKVHPDFTVKVEVVGELVSATVS
jgi:polyisoprenoid-binding protein YceI